MKKLLVLIIMILGFVNTFAAKDSASVKVNITARIVDSAAVKTVKADKKNVTISLNEMKDEFGKVNRTVVTSKNSNVKKSNDNLFTLDLVENLSNDIVVLTVINS